MGSFQIKQNAPSLIKFSYPTDEKFANIGKLVESYKGNTAVFDFIWYENGVTKDMTGLEIRFSMKQKQFDTEYIIYLSTVTAGFESVSNITVLNPPQGYFRITLIPRDTNLLSVGDHMFLIDAVDTSGNVTTIFKDYAEFR